MPPWHWEDLLTLSFTAALALNNVAAMFTDGVDLYHQGNHCKQSPSQVPMTALLRSKLKTKEAKMMNRMLIPVLSVS